MHSHWDCDSTKSHCSCVRERLAYCVCRPEELHTKVVVVHVGRWILLSTALHRDRLRWRHVINTSSSRANFSNKTSFAIMQFGHPHFAEADGHNLMCIECIIIYTTKKRKTPKDTQQNKTQMGNKTIKSIWAYAQHQAEWAGQTHTNAINISGSCLSPKRNLIVV